MSRHDDTVRMRHMLDFAREVMALTSYKSKEQVLADRVLSLALVHLLEMIGEAAGKIEPAVRASHQNIPWPQIIGLRNRLIHGYDSVNMDVLWKIITDDLPVLVKALEGILTP